MTGSFHDRLLQPDTAGRIGVQKVDVAIGLPVRWMAHEGIEPHRGQGLLLHWPWVLPGQGLPSKHGMGRFGYVGGS